MELKDLMNAFFDRAGLDPVGPNEIGAYELSADGTDFSVIALDALGETALLVAAVGTRPSEGSGELAEVLLGVNYLFASTGGATVAYDAARERYVLQRTVSLPSLSAEAFAATLDAFVGKAEELGALLSRTESVLTILPAAAPEEARPDDPLSRAFV